MHVIFYSTFFIGICSVDHRVYVQAFPKCVCSEIDNGVHLMNTE